MAKAVEMSVIGYADSVGVSRGSIYRWIKDREAGMKSKLPKNVKVKYVTGHPILVVPSEK